MLVLPTTSLPYFTIVGIDPGSTLLGVGMINVDIQSLSILSSSAFTLNGSRLSSDKCWTYELYGDRITRIKELELELIKIFNYCNPLVIAAESPFINMRRPGAFAALTEVICAIRNAVTNYDQWKVLELIDPATIKRGVGAMGNADKNMMKQKVCGITELNYVGFNDIATIDEHSIDALAVAWWKYNDLLKQLNIK